jgi:flagellar basal-body rod modification protein FlgD
MIDSVAGTTDPTAPTAPASSSGSSSDPTTLTNPNGALGQDTFLNLLATQLQNQDPLNPQPDGEFLSELAQFSSLEDLTEIRDSMNTLTSIFTTGLSPTNTDSSASPGSSSSNSSAAGSTGNDTASTNAVGSTAFTGGI